MLPNEEMYPYTAKKLAELRQSQDVPAMDEMTM